MTGAVCSAPRISAIALDMDGVIVDSDRCHAAAYLKLWEEIGVDPQPYHAIAGRPTVDVVAEHTRHLNVSSPDLRSWVERKQSLARELLGEVDVLFPDARASLDLLGSRFPLALVTGGSRRTVDATLRRYDLQEVFRVVITAADVESGKPAPDAYLQAARSIAPGRSPFLVVEDSSSGIEAGLAAGAFVVSVRSGERHDDRRFLGRFETLMDVVAWLGLVA